MIRERLLYVALTGAGATILAWRFVSGAEGGNAARLAVVFSMLAGLGFVDIRRQLRRDRDDEK